MPVQALFVIARTVDGRTFTLVKDYTLDDVQGRRSLQTEEWLHCRDGSLVNAAHVVSFESEHRPVAF